jgi:ABC-2 type transport system ATP-binding protein
MEQDMDERIEQNDLQDGAGEVIATLSGVHHHYGSVHALRGIDLDVRRGEVLAVLGPNGAGKTTAINVLLGMLRPESGSASVFDMDPDHSAVRTRRAAMLQISGLPPVLKVREHLELFSAYYPAPLPSAQVLRMAGLEDIAERHFKTLSGGQKQRLMFALALTGDPELVFLDEPTAGLDLEARRRLWDEIRALKDSGRTVLLTTHYLEEADALADRIAVIHEGRVIAEGSPAQIKSRTAGRRVRCITSVNAEALRALPGVVSVALRGQHKEMLTARAEALVRELMNMDPALSDLEVTGAGLEEAFLALTGGDIDDTTTEAA